MEIAALYYIPTVGENEESGILCRSMPIDDLLRVVTYSRNATDVRAVRLYPV